MTPRIHHVTRNGGGGRGRRGGDDGSRKTGCREGGKSQSETFVSKSQTPLQWEGPHLWRRQGCGCLKCSDWWKSAGCWTEPGRSGAAEERPLLEDTQVVRRSSSRRNRPPSVHAQRTRKRRPGAQGRAGLPLFTAPLSSQSAKHLDEAPPTEVPQTETLSSETDPRAARLLQTPHQAPTRGTWLRWNCGV